MNSPMHNPCPETRIGSPLALPGLEHLPSKNEDDGTLWKGLGEAAQSPLYSTMNN